MKMPVVRMPYDGRTWTLEQEYTYYLDDGRVVYVPCGFKFDFASVPRLFWRFAPPATGKHALASLVHDWIVGSGAATWNDAADIFVQVMKRSGVGYIKRNVMYKAVVWYEVFHKTDPRQQKLRDLQQACPEYVRLLDQYVVL